MLVAKLYGRWPVQFTWFIAEICRRTLANRSLTVPAWPRPESRPSARRVSRLGDERYRRRSNSQAHQSPRNDHGQSRNPPGDFALLSEAIKDGRIPILQIAVEGGG